jgi:hypothetical protein
VTGIHVKKKRRMRDDFWRQAQELEERLDFEIRMQRLKESASDALAVEGEKNPRLSEALRITLQEIEEVLNKVNGVTK